jgi:triphosphatase
MQELELKVELSKSDMDRLAGELAASDLGVGPAATKELRTVYFDTPEHDLHAAGVSLRLRRQKGGWQQTVKVDQHVERGVSRPIELQTFVEKEWPDIRKISDKKVRRAVQEALAGTSLRPIFETVVQRTIRSIKIQDSEIELAVDDGEVRAGIERQDLREAELELKAGSAEGLLLAAEKLLDGHELELPQQGGTRLSTRAGQEGQQYRTREGAPSARLPQGQLQEGALLYVGFCRQASSGQPPRRP